MLTSMKNECRKEAPRRYESTDTQAGRSMPAPVCDGSVCLRGVWRSGYGREGEANGRKTVYSFRLLED